MTNRLSIIIPTLNEADNIISLINHLDTNASLENISEIILVDGGSTDGTTEKVKTYVNSSDLNAFKSKITLINAPRGRAKQMNLGAKHATGNILYFLHADSFPPKNFDQLIIKQIANGHKAGCFRLQFDNNHWWLRLASWLTQFSWRACRGGDQSQFITKALFEEIHGYDESYIIYEDNILINELYVRKEFVVINKKLITSARLYEKYGIWKVQYHFWAIYVKKWFGASATDLYNYYKKHFV